MMGRHEPSSRRGRWKAPVALGLGVGLAIPHLRKALAQGPSVAAGSWDASLAAEHKAVMALLDTMIDTPAEAKTRRKLLLAKIEWALSKHAYAEETVIYPALRANGVGGDKALYDDHGEIKILLAALRDRPADIPAWEEDARALKTLLETHMAEEETDLFAELRSKLPKDENARLTALVNAQALRLA